MSNKFRKQYSHLTRAQIDEPLLLIEDFCRRDTYIEQFRLDLRDFIKSSCSNQLYGDRENHFYTYRCLMQILEAVHILYKKQKTYSIDSNKEIPKSDFHNLSKKEVTDTYIFFKDFFNYQSLNKWRLTFSRLGEYAYRKTTIDEVIEEGSVMVIIREYIEKLIEVIFLIDYTQTGKQIRKFDTLIRLEKEN